MTNQTRGPVRDGEERDPNVADQRNRLGAPPRVGNENPGQGKGGYRVGGGSAPGTNHRNGPAEQLAKSIGSSLAEGDPELVERVRKGRELFDEYFDAEKMKQIMDSLHERAVKGHVQAALGILHLKGGKPVAQVESNSSHRVTGKMIGDSLEGLLQRRAEGYKAWQEELESQGIATIGFDEALEQGLWDEDDEDAD